MRLNRVQLVAIFFASISVLFFFMTPSIRIPPNLSEPGPRLFPYFAEALIFVCSILMFFSKENREKTQKSFLSREGWKKLGLSLALMVAYTIGLYAFGFILASLAATLAFVYVLRDKDRVNLGIAVVVAIVATASIYFIFTKAFGIALPVGRIIAF